MKKLITALMVLVSTQAFALDLGEEVLRYEFATSYQSSFFHNYETVEVNVWDVGRVTITKYNNIMAMGQNFTPKRSKSVIASKAIWLSGLATAQILDFADAMATADLSETAFMPVCAKMASPADAIDNLYVVVNFDNKVLVDSSHDCTQGNQVHPADDELHKDAHAIKNFLRNKAFEALGPDLY